MADGFLFYRSYIDSVKKLPKEFQLDALLAIIDYSLDEKEPEEDGIASALLAMAKPTIDKNRKLKANSAKGGEANRERIASQAEAKGEPSDSQTGAKTEPNSENAEPPIRQEIKDKRQEIKDIENTPHNPPTGETAFKPPSVEEVADYIFEKGYSFDAEEFVAYYASQKWKKANGRPLSDWQAACRTWECKRKARSGTNDDFDRMMAEWVREKNNDGE